MVRIEDGDETLQRHIEEAPENADESSDISGKEQTSLGVRFVDTTKPGNLVREEFVGFTELNELNAESVANAIVNQPEKFCLNLDRMFGQGDGCSTMAGKERGLQAKNKRRYPTEFGNKRPEFSSRN